MVYTKWYKCKLSFTIPFSMTEFSPKLNKWDRKASKRQIDDKLKNEIRILNIKWRI